MGFTQLIFRKHFAITKTFLVYVGVIYVSIMTSESKTFQVTCLKMPDILVRHYSCDVLEVISSVPCLSKLRIGVRV